MKKLWAGMKNREGEKKAAIVTVSSISILFSRLLHLERQKEELHFFVGDMIMRSLHLQQIDFSALKKEKERQNFFIPFDFCYRAAAVAEGNKRNHTIFPGRVTSDGKD